MLIGGVTKLELCMKQAKLLWYKKQLQQKQLQLKQLQQKQVQLKELQLKEL